MAFGWHRVGGRGVALLPRLRTAVGGCCARNGDPQGVVFRGVVHGIEAAVKVISHREEADAAAANKSAPGSSAGDKRSMAGGTAGDGSNRPRIAAPAALESPMVDETRMRERKRNLLRDALELAVTTTISHPNIVQVRDRAEGACTWYCVGTRDHM